MWSRGAQHCIWSMNMNDFGGGALGVCMCSLQVARECGELLPAKTTLTGVSTVHSVHKVSAGGEGWGECVTCISTVSLNRATVGWLYVVLEVNTRVVLKGCHGCLVSEYTGRLWTRKGMKQLRPLDYGGSSVITHRPKVGIRQRIEGQRGWRDPWAPRNTEWLVCAR